MKNALSILTIFLLSSLTIQLNAQTDMDNDKIYKEELRPNSNTISYHLKLMMTDYDNQVLLNPDYLTLVKQKWEARTSINQILIDDQNMTVEVKIDALLTDQEVMDILKKLNPNVTAITSQ